MEPDNQPPSWSAPEPAAVKPKRRKGTGRVAVGIYAFLGGLVIAAAGASGGDADPGVAAEPAPTVTVTATSDPRPAETVEVEVPGPTVTTTVTTKAIPRPVSEPKPAAEPEPAADLDTRYGTCEEAIDAGLGPYTSGVDPEYDWYDDRDDDGVVCE